MFERRQIRFIAGALMAGLLAACGSNSNSAGSDRGFLGGLVGGGGATSDQVEAGIGVNSFLWRASLDTLSFMPLSEVDPFGGVIITDWYANPEIPSERFKATVYILDTRLRADALSVQLFKQINPGDGVWQDTTIDPATRLQVENAILTRARRLRIAQIEG
jgi:hypothetical protein